MALIINIETSTSICSVTLAQDGKTLAMREDTQGQAHATALTVFMKEVLNEACISPDKLQAIAVSKGPGSYTGLRIGVSAAKGMCFALNIPLLAVETLQSLVHQIVNRNSSLLPQNIDKTKALFCPMLDARRMEVYTALYSSDLVRQTEISAEIIDENFLKDKLASTKIIFFGNGAEKCESIIKHENAIFIQNIQTSAQDLNLLSAEMFNRKEFVDTAYFEPFYLKDFVATERKVKI